MNGTLEKLLERIRDGVAAPDEIAHARALVRGDARLPDELRSVGLTDEDDLAGDAVGLLAVLGAAPLFGDGLRDVLADAGSAMVPDEADDGWEHIAEVLRDGLVEAARDIEVADAVMMRLPPAWAYGPATAQAVEQEAGSIDVADAAMTELGAADSLEMLVAEAVRAEAGRVDVVADVLVELGLGTANVLPLAEAVAAEAGDVDVVGSVLAELALGSANVLPVAEAVDAEAGSVDVVPLVLSSVGEQALPVAEAIAAEAGSVDLVDEVFAALELSASVAVAEAVRAEAGDVDVAGAVMDAVAPAAPAAAPSMPAAVQSAPPVPQPVNRSVVLGAVLMAAVALLTFAGLSQWAPGGGEAPQAQAEIVFAAAGDVVVEDLDYADDVVVMQAEGDEGAVILWMEGA